MKFHPKTFFIVSWISRYRIFSAPFTNILLPKALRRIAISVISMSTQEAIYTEAIIRDSKKKQVSGPHGRKRGAQKNWETKKIYEGKFWVFIWSKIVKFKLLCISTKYIFTSWSLHIKLNKGGLQKQNTTEH